MYHTRSSKYGESGSPRIGARVAAKFASPVAQYWAGVKRFTSASQAVTSPVMIAVRSLPETSLSSRYSSNVRQPGLTARLMSESIQLQPGVVAATGVAYPLLSICKPFINQNVNRAP